MLSRFSRISWLWAPLLLLGGAPMAHANFGVEPVSPKAYVLFEVGGIPVTNSMVTTWVISLVVIIAVRLIVGVRPRMVPTKLQSVLEIAVEKLYGMTESIVGKRAIGLAFPLLFSLFLYILIMNWSSLFPGVGTFGMYDEHGHLTYFFRPATSDLNTTLALALVAVIGWVFLAFRYSGVKGVAHEVFGNKADKRSVPAALYWFLGLLFLAVGVIELISYVFRPVSLTFRLYGNVFGGETLLSNMFGLSSVLGLPLEGFFRCALALPFYFLELLIGFVQALVFMLLTSVYIGINVNHSEDSHVEEAPAQKPEPQQTQS